MESMTCTKCGGPLPADAPKGLCPRCLMAIGLAANPSAFGTATQGEIRSEAVALSGPRPGTRLRYFGDYELIERIAQGGMGVVYKARQVSLNRVVALKMILGGQLASDAEVQRFLTEAEAAANLQHPHIVSIHEVGEHEGQHYFSMDFVDGPNLAEFSRARAISPAEAAELVRVLAEATHYAHQRGTLHRDLKPSNILMDAHGQPRITDFGLAKLLAHESDLTHTGAVLGSPSYMAPEQAAGQNHLTGPSADVYSLGAILYHLLTGRPPFVGESTVGTIRKVMEDEPVAPSRLNPNTPSDLETICLKCLEKRPERRYYSAGDLSEELRRFLRHEPIWAQPATAWRKLWSWGQRRPWAIVGVAVILGTVLLGFSYGLWEQVRFLEWRNTNPNARRPGDMGAFFSRVLYTTNAAILLLVPLILYYQWLKSRRRRNLPPRDLELGLLALGGLSLIGAGLGLDAYVIRTFVWSRLAPAYTFAGISLGTPLLLCWFGGIFALQALRWRQAHWSGLPIPSDLFEARPLQSNARAFAVTLAVNLALFAALSFIAIPDGTFPEYEFSTKTGEDIEALDLPPHVPYGLTDGPKLVPLYGMMRIGFFLLAFGVSLAPRLIAARRIIPAPVSIFYWLFFIGGTALVHLYFLSTAAYVTGVLAGLGGGWILLKAARLEVIGAKAGELRGTP